MKNQKLNLKEVKVDKRNKNSKMAMKKVRNQDLAQKNLDHKAEVDLKKNRNPEFQNQEFRKVCSNQKAKVYSLKKPRSQNKNKLKNLKLLSQINLDREVKVGPGRD